MDISEFFERQNRLQIESFKGEPALMQGQELIEFIRWNVLALEDELHEALAEVVWKPWSSAPPDFINSAAFIKELVDAFHFLMNLVLAATHSADEAAEIFTDLYFKKADRNAERQTEGYTGLDKCAKCHRDRQEAGVERMLVGHTESSEPVYRICCSACFHPVDLNAENEEICTVCRVRRSDAGTYTSAQQHTLPDGTVVTGSRTHCGVCHSPVIRHDVRMRS